MHSMSLLLSVAHGPLLMLVLDGTYWPPMAMKQFQEYGQEIAWLLGGVCEKRPKCFYRFWKSGPLTAVIPFFGTALCQGIADDSPSGMFGPFLDDRESSRVMHSPSPMVAMGDQDHSGGFWKGPFFWNNERFWFPPQRVPKATKFDESYRGKRKWYCFFSGT